MNADNLTAKQRFDNSVNHEIRRLIHDAEVAYDKKVHDEYDLGMIESLTMWYDEQEKKHLPVSFAEWLAQLGDSI